MKVIGFMILNVIFMGVTFLALLPNSKDQILPEIHRVAITLDVIAFLFFFLSVISFLFAHHHNRFINKSSHSYPLWIRWIRSNIVANLHDAAYFHNFVGMLVFLASLICFMQVALGGTAANNQDSLSLALTIILSVSGFVVVVCIGIMGVLIVIMIAYEKDKKKKGNKKKNIELEDVEDNDREEKEDNEENNEEKEKKKKDKDNDVEKRKRKKE